MLDSTLNEIQQPYSTDTLTALSTTKSTLLKLIQALIREEIIPFSMKDNYLTFLSSTYGREFYVSNVKLSTLKRCIDFNEIYYRNNGKIERIVSTSQFLDYLYPFMNKLTNNKIWDRLLKEIKNHTLNSNLSERISKNIKFNIAASAKNMCQQDMLSWVNSNESILDKSVYMEQFVSQGHPTHPCSKTKLGFSKEDAINYSPEFSPIVKILVVAMHKSISGISLSLDIQKSYREWFFDVFPEEYTHWGDALRRNGLEIADYFPIPIHPWQFENSIKRNFKEYISNKLLCFFDDVYIEASPTLSFRTLKPINNLNAPYIKLPVAIQATSVFRTLAPTSVKNSTITSDLLADIFHEERNFNEQLKILPEVAGIYLNDGSAEASHLGAIFRSSINNIIKADENCIVVASLCERSPITQTPIFMEQMSLAGIKDMAGAVSYFRYYAAMVIKSYLGLYLRYGIALEGHQQNTMAVFKDGLPQYIVARDFDGIDIERSVYENYAGPLKELNSVISNSPEMPRNNLLHTVYQSHLGELIILLTTHFNCSEIMLWSVVSKLTHQQFDNLRGQIDAKRWETEYNAILQKDWACRALLRMRLSEEYHRDGLFVRLRNPLRLSI
jgi:D-ornithine---citrate ligase